MVGVDVGVEDVAYLPPALLGELDVDRRLKGSVDYYCLVAGPDDVGESPLAGAPDL